MLIFDSESKATCSVDIFSGLSIRSVRHTGDDWRRLETWIDLFTSSLYQSVTPQIRRPAAPHDTDKVFLATTRIVNGPLKMKVHTVRNKLMCGSLTGVFGYQGGEAPLLHVINVAQHPHDSLEKIWL
ncbi:hypothetical protein N657DRAFT_636324 [Parathielavia appendiculata]|uniref:Uncharacterized protein n=1 Tax=Parathielavia appendiculata TaxID=2587402 RepID=A0AAN6Z0P9_9PEZI|nr:hypothetical protein N657DRAFT_636324 [Parathielavia appendiculata]